MNMLTGFIEQTSGEIVVDGFDMLKKPKKAKKEIGYMPEGVPLYTDLTVKEFVTYMAEIKKVDRKTRKEEVEKIIEKTGLKDVEKKLIKNLSRGYKQRTGMAGALVGAPKILILDEPTVGLDPKQITEIRNLIKELGKTHTVILSSHILSEVSQICNKVIIINKGKLVAIDTPENLENKVLNKNCIYVTVEDPENKMKDMKDIKQWYWVFVRACSKRAADAIVGSSCTDEFVEYLLISAPPICYEEWFELLLTYDISDKIKSRMISELENLSYGEK